VTLRRDEWVSWPFAPLVVDGVEPLEVNVARVLEAARTIIAERPERPHGDDPTEGGAVPDGEKETPEGTPSP
jgi:hypothetical protein